MDPRVGGAGESLAAAVFQRYGRDGLKKLFVDQDVMLIKGNVEVAEQVVRKVRPISLTSVSPDSQHRFKDAGDEIQYRAICLFRRLLGREPMDRVRRFSRIHPIQMPPKYLSIGCCPVTVKS